MTRLWLKSRMTGLEATALCLDNRTMQPLAYLDRDFLDSEEARPIRILAEYLEPLRRFRAQNIQDTVVFFGSARIHSREHAEAALAKLMQRLTGTVPDADEGIIRGRKAVEWSRYYEDARELAKLLTTWSRRSEERRVGKECRARRWAND